MSLRQRGHEGESNHASGQTSGDDDSTVANDKSQAHQSNERNEFMRRLFLSPCWKLAVFCIVGFVPVFGTVFSLPKILKLLGCITVFCEVKYYVPACYLSMMFLYNFFQAQFTDPGRTDGIKPTFETTGQFQMMFDETDSSESSKYKQIGSSDPLMYAQNYCNHCKHFKPPRSHHCSFCKRCTLRMDHHCPFTGNCIGLNNHGHFILMYLWASIGLLYSLCLCFLGMHLSQGNLAKVRRMPMPRLETVGYLGMAKAAVKLFLIYIDPLILGQTVVTVIACAAVFSTGSMAAYHALQGRTMLESSFPMKEYVQIKKSIFCPLGNGFYNLGWSRNLHDILGPQWYLRLFLPTKGVPLEPHVGIAPRPSEVGVKALLGRIRQVELEGIKTAPVPKEQLGIVSGPDSPNSGSV